MTAMFSEDAAATIENVLPQLRRYARALTGNKVAADCLTEKALEQLVANPKLIVDFETPKTALFHACHGAWTTAGSKIWMAETRPEVSAQLCLAGIPRNARAALLLTSLERFSTREVADIMGINLGEVDELLRTAYARWRH